MNIVIVDCFDTWEHRVDLLHKVFVSEGHKVKCLLSDFRHIEKVRRTGEKKDFLFFHADEYRRNISLARLRSHIRLSKRIFTYLDRHSSSIDLLWVLAPPNVFIKDAAEFKKANSRVRLVIDLIDLWPETMPVGRIKPLLFPWRMLRDKYIGSADTVITECNLYQKVLGSVLDGKDVHTLYLAREDKGYEPRLTLPDDKINLCYLGSINNIIDINEIGRVIAECRKIKPVELHIIGDGEKKGELIRASESARASVVDHGKVYDRRLKQGVFDACHYGLNIMKSSVCVGLTMKSIDYFEFGLPIINNIKGDTWDIIEKYGCGVNLDNGLSSEKLESLSVTRLNKSMRNKCREFFTNTLTEDIFKKKIVEIISPYDQPRIKGCMQKKHTVRQRSSNYGINEIIRNGISVIRSRIEFPKARLIRYPIIVRGKSFINFGNNLTIGYNCRIEVNGKHTDKVLTFGDNVNIGDNVSIRCAERITIGNSVLMGSRVLIIDNSHGNYNGDNQDNPEVPPNQRGLYTAPITIEDNVWIGEGAVIQAGVNVGSGSIIAANAVITKSIEANVIVGGIPAKVLKRWNSVTQKWEPVG